MASSRTTAEVIQSGLGSKDLEANLSTPMNSTAVAGHGAAARMFSCVGDLDAACFFIALCGLWTNAMLHALLVLSYLTQSAPNHESLCWSLAVAFWGIVALSVHSIRHASRASMTRDLSCTRSDLGSQPRIAEALMLTVLIAWYRDAIAQKTSPYKELFSMCNSSAQWEVGYTSVYDWGSIFFGMTVSQCDLATAIVKVTWVGPVALLFAVWTMLLKWLSSPAEVSENVSIAEALKSFQSLPGHQLDYVRIKHLEGEYSAHEDTVFVN